MQCDAVNEGLLACPFCGNAPFKRFKKNINGEQYPDHWFIWCENLDCTATPEAMEETLEETAKAWNTRAVPSPDTSPVVSIKPMALSDGRKDYFVSIKVGDREVTPHVFREEFKAAYHVALYDWLLNGSGDEPEIMDFSETDWPARIVRPSPDTVGVRIANAEIVNALRHWETDSRVDHATKWLARDAANEIERLAALSPGRREEIARCLAYEEWPHAKADERKRWEDKYWREWLRHADAILALTSEQSGPTAGKCEMSETSHNCALRGRTPSPPDRQQDQDETSVLARGAFAEPVAKWYLASKNDGLFIINAEPRPSNDDQWHDRPNGPTIVLNITELPEAKAAKIVSVLNASPPVSDASREA